MRSTINKIDKLVVDPRQNGLWTYIIGTIININSFRYPSINRTIHKYNKFNYANSICNRIANSNFHNL